MALLFSPVRWRLAYIYIFLDGYAMGLNMRYRMAILLVSKQQLMRDFHPRGLHLVSR